MADKTPTWYPTLDGKVDPAAEIAIRRLYQTTQDHDQAIVTLKSQVDAAMTAAAAATATTTTTTTNSSAVPSGTDRAATGSTFLGGVNTQAAAYTVQNNDYAKLIVVNDASPSTVTLNSAVAQAWYGFVENLGAGTVTLQPDLGGATINGVATITVTTGASAVVFFDGANWWAATVPPAGAGGVPSVNGITSAVTIAGGSGLTATVAGSTVTLAPDSTHLLATNTGTATTYLDGTGAYSTPAGAGGTILTTSVNFTLLTGTSQTISQAFSIVGIANTTGFVVSLQTPLPFTGGFTGIVEATPMSYAYFHVSVPNNAILVVDVPAPPAGTSYTIGTYTMNIKAIL